MARAIPCDEEDGQAAVLLITRLADGATLSVCGDHVEAVLQSLLDAMRLATIPLEAEAAPAETEATVANGKAGVPLRGPNYVSRSVPPGRGRRKRKAREEAAPDPFAPVEPPPAEEATPEP